MGRKVHPIGFRLKINKTWESRWFAEGKEYAQRLHQDAEIRRLILKNASDAAIARVEIERDHNLVRVFVFTAKPGVFIGRKGAAVKELRQQLEKITGCKVDLKVQEITQPDTSAPLVADNIARQLERRISHNRAMKRAVAQAIRQGAQGVKVMCAGRLSGSEMKRTEWMREGRVPLQWLRADVDFARTEALTTFGRIGVKVWIYKGEARPETEEKVGMTEGAYVSE
ncbi:MAG: 30S ribosomal protein S3 [Anaerolineales bacterium]|nr:30S ribosomal protein S3 [Anaerolineales bacterium]